MRKSNEICENLGFRWLLSLWVGAGLKYEKSDLNTGTLSLALNVLVELQLSICILFQSLFENNNYYVW